MDDSEATFGEFEDWFNNLSEEKKGFIKAQRQLAVSLAKYNAIDFKFRLYQEYGRIRENHSRKESYDILIRFMERWGREPKEYEMNGYRNFDKAYRRWLHRQFKKGT